MDETGLLIEFQNYEYVLTRIIPSIFTSLDDIDSAFGDELNCLLHARDELEQQINENWEEEAFTPYWRRILELDMILRAKRDIVLCIVPDFSRWRKRFKSPPPRSHWWWYLDELVAESYQSHEKVIALPTDRLALTLDSEVIARTGLRPGQQVTVQVSDDKHIVVSLA